MKIVINRCFGGFGLSPKALLALHERGMPGIATPIEEAYHPRNADVLKRELATWRRYAPGNKSGFLTIFSSDEKFVLYGGRLNEHRAHPDLVRVVEEMGAEASGDFAELAVIEIPDGVDWEIEEYDGNETVAEKHRTWR